MTDTAPLWLPCLFGAHEWEPPVILRDDRVRSMCRHCSTWRDATPQEEADLRHTRSRRSVLLTRALHHPEGLTPYQFTRGMTKDDALQFWNDAKALGLIGVGQSKRGSRMFALSSYEAPRVRA